MSIKVHDMFLVATWNQKIIKSVDITFHLILIFSKPSVLRNTTAVTLNKNYFHLSLQGNESCDLFTLCITGNNSVGRSNTSCINGSLPYVPSEDMIRYSLSSSQGEYILLVSITVSDLEIIRSFCNLLFGSALTP